MVSIVGQESPSDLIGKIVGQGIQQNLPSGLERTMDRQRGMSALDQAQQDIQAAGGDPFKIAMAFARAGAQNPGLERSLGPLYESAMTRAQAINAQKAPLAGEVGQTQRDRSPVEPMAQRENAPNFLDQPGQENKFFPNNLGPQEEVGNRPQAATSGVKVPLLTPSEQVKNAKELAAQRTAAHIPTSPQQALAEIQEHEKSKELHNANVDKELAARVKSQREYGKKAESDLLAVHPEATAEQKAIFQKVGEDISARGGSEAEINRAIAKEATKFKNSIENVRNDISAPRLYNRIHRMFLGTDKDFDQAASDMRQKLKPILDLGLYDTARNLLSEQGYAPEERESIINPLDDRSKSILRNTPKYYRHQRPENIEAQDQNLKGAISDVLKNSPNASLPLIRKGLEDRGYEWNDFRKALNELVEANPDLLTDDQKTQISVLDSPPLNYLERYLEALNLVGR